MKTKIFIALCILTFNCLAQENLQFSKVFFLPISSEKSSDFIAKDTTITVPNGKVWQITNAKVFMTYDNRVIGDKTYLYLNEQIITYATNTHAQITDPLWLPSGKYRVTIRTEEKNQRAGRFYYNAFISGVEYNVSK
ncbi:MAG: hypothetical protein COX07_02115 [Bacteroidetes bacterium CG23_combo_of_CG06-09_8_20_14_all_32_9]|nr:MAG: hypothetical protein COX07_02115 [Bacteroidetes bacterium CG23_combo_of_CG06-09_8_20_14_all_32_9]